MVKLLWEELGLDENFRCSEIDDVYRKIRNKTPRVKKAWKVLRDNYYSEVYREYKSEEVLDRAGFIFDTLELNDMDYYNINLLTTPFDKLKKDVEYIKNPVVLLSTGGFNPIHEGHIKMMEEAKKVLTNDGYDVIGGYFSLSHEDYIATKPYYIKNQYERIDEARKYLKASDWLMADPFESLYVKTIVNFTDVVERLEQYLQKHVDKRIRVAYVFGGDNVEFMYCFKRKGLAVCLNRNGYNEKFLDMKKQASEGMYFIDNSDDTSELSSRDFRKQAIKEKEAKEYNGIYLVRNEGLRPFEHYVTEDNVGKLLMLQREFLNKLVKLLSDTFEGKVPVKVLDIEGQLKEAEECLSGKKTINLDSYFKGTYNLEVSRLFSISSYQDKYIDLVGRLGHESIREQISKIDKGHYILVDDDSVTGRTLKSVREKLPSDVIIDDTYILANKMNDEVFDVVDLRDFVIGASNSGLVVQLPNKEILRVPYVMPYVNLTTRASIEPSKEREFTIKIWKMNKEFYTQLNSNLKLKDADESFRRLMNYIGFEDETKIIDICEWHICKLQLSEEKLPKTEVFSNGKRI